MREHWSSKFGFLFASVGSAVGLGLLWKFPYTVGQNGGGFFLLAYVLFLILLGIPVFIGEVILGRSSQKSAICAFTEFNKERDFWKLGAYFGVMSSFLIMSYYSVIAGYGMSYVLMSLMGNYAALGAGTESAVSSAYANLSGSAGISLFWHVAFSLITLSIVAAGIRKGVEFWAKIMTKMLLVILIFFAIYALFLPGWGQAFHFIFSPKANAFSFSSLMEALGLAFFTMSLGQGIMISYGSYMGKKESIVGLSFIVGISVLVVAILASMMIFPVVFSFDISPASGPSLIFETMPYLFSKLPGATLFASLFFILFVFTALTSAIPLVEVVASNLMEVASITRKKAAWIAGGSCMVFGIPSALAGSGVLFSSWQAIYGMNFLKTIDHLVTVWLIPLSALITALFIGWGVSRERVREEFVMNKPFLAGLFQVWIRFMRWVVPVVIIVLILQNSGVVNFEYWLNKI
ncbi:sodium-dependent transporter [Candidatus Aerophobetes bacterium]|uniref:Transporter n=1 Tax=Aerophobetes bacterium TaxID=2030807 RepID=A0A2A4X4V3_UNCAE|nr:MAG: sodium-dependent transporter [Candidatus Aerophobetes bacterium]